MKRIILVSLLIFISHKTFSQTKPIYFKAGQSYLWYKDNRKPLGPIECTDIILFNFPYKQIIVLSDAARVFTILNQGQGVAENGNPYIKYYTSDEDGNKLTFTYLIADSKIRIIMDDPRYPYTIFEGEVKKVY